MEDVFGRRDSGGDLTRKAAARSFDVTKGYRAITRTNIERFPEWTWLPDELREVVRVVGRVLPFRTNPFVTRRLIDWERIPEDPIYQLTFPQRGMLTEEEYASIEELIDDEASADLLDRTVRRIHGRLNPHPAGQVSHNVPILHGHPLEGVQHKYPETVLFFPAQGQTCHAYCSYCFRWPQFLQRPGLRFRARSPQPLIRYLKLQPEVTDLLLTGGDPLVMKTALIERYLAPILDADIDHLRNIRIGTKALSYWPYRFLADPDADDLLRLFERVVESGRSLALMAHICHDRELEPEVVRRAIRRVRSAGVEIRLQAPLIRHVNDSPEVWSGIWRRAVQLGMIPYYMFVERNTGAQEYFAVSLHRAQQIYHEAIRQVSGLARTARGPSMSAFPGKVQILGTAQIGVERVFVLQFLQAREPSWVGRPFFARYDPEARWLDDLKPAFGQRRFFFERDREGWAVPTVA